MILTDKYRNILDSAIRKYGAEKQFMMAIEEMAELTKEICKIGRGKDNRAELCEEIADVLITVSQAARMAGEDEVMAQIEQKMKRLENKLEGK